MGRCGMAAAVVPGCSLPKAKSKQVLCPGLLPFPSPLVLLHVLTKPARVISKIVLVTRSLLIHPSIQSVN